MNKIIRSLLVPAVFAVATHAYAVQRTFVSAQHGLDTNPCSVTQPCRTFGAALTATSSGGEVIALDSGGYGPVTIAQPVSLIAPSGVYAGVTTTAPGDGIYIGGVSGVVNLRGLTLNGLNGTGGFGLNAFNTTEVHAENLVVFGFATGISFEGTGKYFVSGSTVRSNSNIGFVCSSSDINNPARASIDGSSFNNNGNVGVVAAGYSKVVMRDSVAAYNVTGIEAGYSAGISEIQMHGSEAAFNTFAGVYAFNSGISVINVSSSHITENVTGVLRAGVSTVNSAGDNVLRYNTTDGSFNGTFALQ